jgi:ribosome-associated protein
MLVVNSRIRVPLEELEFTYARSGGPGGQNVNKVNSKAVLRWRAVANTSLPPDVRGRFLSKFASRLTTDGDILITSTETRDQQTNAQNCLDKLREMLLSVAEKPIPRKKTKPTLGSRRRKRAAKSERSQKKQGRRSPGVEE